MFTHLSFHPPGTRSVQIMHAVNYKPFQPLGQFSVYYKYSIDDYGMGIMSWTCPSTLLSSFCANCTLGPVQMLCGRWG